MGEVIPICSQAQAEAAWADYQEHARALSDNPKLSVHRPFMQELWRREKLAKRLFWRLEA